MADNPASRRLTRFPGPGPARRPPDPILDLRLPQPKYVPAPPPGYVASVPAPPRRLIVKPGDVVADPRPTRYRSRRGILASTRRFLCPTVVVKRKGRKGKPYRYVICYAAHEGKRLHILPWTYAFTLTGPRCLQILNVLPLAKNVAANRTQPFWWLTISDQRDGDPKTLDPRKAVPHVHGLIGGLGEGDYDRLVSTLRILDRNVSVKRVTHAFGWIHYAIVQEKAIPARDGRLKDISGKLRHARDRFSYCLRLMQPPIESPNLTRLVAFYRDRLRALRKPPRKTLFSPDGRAKP